MAIWPCPIRLRGCNRRAMSVYRLAAAAGARLPARRARLRGRTATATRCTGTTTSRSRWSSRGGGTFRSGAVACPRSAGDVFFIDNSQPHVALADPGTTLAPPARPVPAGADRRVPAAASSTSATSRRSAPTSRSPAPRVPAGSPAGRRARGRPPSPARDPPAARSGGAASRGRHAPASRSPSRPASRAPAPAPRLAARSRADRREQIRPVLAYVDRHCGERITARRRGQARPRQPVARPPRVQGRDRRQLQGVPDRRSGWPRRSGSCCSTDLSVAEVARGVSYTNLHQFYKVFYRSCAMSPGEYRRYYTPSGGGGASPAATAPPTAPQPA